jgi:hypothetical protein
MGPRVRKFGHGGSVGKACAPGGGLSVSAARGRGAMKERAAARRADTPRASSSAGITCSGCRAGRTRPHRCSDTHGRKTLEKYRLEAITE